MKKFLSVLVVMLICASFLAGINVYALTIGSITANPNTPGANATYTVQITTAQPVVSPNDYFQITFDSHFYVPSSISKQSIRVNGAYPSSVSVTSNTVYIYPVTTINANSVTTIYLYSSCGIRNPSIGGQSYTITVSTSKESGVGYALYIQSAVRNLTVTPNPLSAGSYATYTVSFIPNITLGTSDHIYIQFPYGTTLPTTIHPSYISINGYHCSYVSKANDTKLDIRPPFTLNANYTYTITISSDFGIKNPVVPGDYTIQLATSKEPVYATSNVYTIVGSNITNLNVSLSPNTAGSNATYTIWFVTGPTGALSSNDYIRIVFPDNTYVPTNTSAYYITINGHNCSYKNVSNRTLTIYIPSGLSIGNYASCSIVISSEFGIKNPTSPGNYTLSLSTSKDTIAAESNSYNIVGTSISNLVVSVTPAVQKANAEYKITFRTSYSGALSLGSDYIYIEFPNAIHLPSYILASYVKVNGTACSSVSVSQSQHKITIRMPVSVGNYSDVTVDIAKDANIKNPDSYGTYKLSVSTSKDIVERTESFDIAKSTITELAVNLTTYEVEKPAGISITFKTGTGGRLKRNQDKIYVLFPVGFSLPYSISASYVKVNNTTATHISRYSNRLEITTPIDIIAGGIVSVVIDKNANIKNPSSMGSYVLTVWTSQETTHIDSAPFNIVALPTTKISVTPASPDGDNGYYKTTPKVTFSATSPIDANPIVYYYFDSGNPIAYNNTAISVPEGIHTLYYYSVDHQGNKETPKTMEFKVDTTPPSLTILSPKNEAVLNTKQCIIKGKTEKGATVTIDNKSVDVGSDGTFTYTTTITGETSFNIIAKDIAGNTKKVVLKVLLDTTPPKLSVTAPYAFQEVHSATVTVEGKTEKDATVKVNGHPVTVKSDYTFTYTVVLTKEGLNSINVTATDLAGNVTKVSVPVTFISRTKIVLQVGNRFALINNKSVELDSPPVIIKGRTLVPLRFISEAFGADVQWNSVFKLIFIKMGKKEIILQIGVPYASVNNKKVTLDSAPVIIKGHTMVPIRFITEALGASVSWDAHTRSVTIILQ